MAQRLMRNRGMAFDDNDDYAGARGVMSALVPGAASLVPDSSPIDPDAAARVLKFLQSKGLSSEVIAQVEALLNTNEYGMVAPEPASSTRVPPITPTTNWMDGYQPDRPKYGADEENLSQISRQLGQDSGRRSGMLSYEEM
jgi:hypothetical protein